MITVGITGGIGSGKSTVASVWSELGATVVYADDLAKKLMRTDPQLKQKLLDLFGEETYLESGELNKPHLIREAFHNERVEELNKAVHPAVRKKIVEMIREAKKNHSESGVFAYEAAILLNNGRPEYVDKVLIVLSDSQLRQERVSRRDSVEAADVIARMNQQPDFRKLTHLADYVIENDGTLEELREKAESLYSKLIGNH